MANDPKQKQESPSISITADDLKEMLRNEREMFMEALKEVKKPFGWDEAQAKLKKIKEQGREDTRLFNELIAKEKARCGHRRKDDGKTTIHWTTYFSDNLPNGQTTFGICCRCTTDFIKGMPLVQGQPYEYWLAQPSSTVELTD